MRIANLLAKTAAVLGAAVMLFGMNSVDSLAATRYVSDGVPHAEGYIIVGESHAVFSSQALKEYVDASGKVRGTNDAYYVSSMTPEVVASDGTPDMFTMKGNVFFVFEGNDSSEGSTQVSKEYIYSDGKGSRGRAVSKIKEIMAANPNVAHWNIISWHGHGAIKNETADGAVANYYVNSYKNWINSEFPGSDIYFLSHGTKTKLFRGFKYPNKVNEALKSNFPSQYLDYTGILTQKADATVDGMHYVNSTYGEIWTSVLKTIEGRRAGVATAAPTMAMPGAVAGEFNAAAYSARYPDLARAGLVTPEQLKAHYDTFGIREGRIPY